MKIQTFDGGVNARQADHLIAVNEAPIYTNVDPEPGTLKASQGLAQTVLGLTDEARYIDYKGQILTLAKTPHTFVEYQDAIYYSVLGDYIQIKDDNQEGDLGLEAPLISGTDIITVRPSAPLVSNISIVATVTAVEPVFNVLEYDDGVQYEFAITFVDANGVESVPYFHSYTVPVGAGSGHSILDITVTGGDFRIYTEVFSGTSYSYWKRFCKLISQNGEAIYSNETFTAGTTIRSCFASLTMSALYIDDVAYSYNGYTDYGFNKGVDIDDLTAGIGGAGTYNYVATLASSTLGWESEPSEAVEIVLATNEDASLEILNAFPDARVDRLNIYRIGNTITDFTLVHTEEDPVFPFSFSDRAVDADIAGNSIMASERHDKCIQGITNLAVANGQLIGSYGTKLLFSEIGKPYAMPPTNYRDFQETITGCFLIDGGLLVFSDTKTWLLNTSNLATGKAIILSGEFGCVGHETIVSYKTGAMWASRVGLCTSFGGKVEVITKNNLGYTDLDITRAQMHNERYVGFTDRGVCYVFDMRYKPAFMGYIFSLLNDYDLDTEVRQVYIEGVDLKILFGSAIAVDSLTVFGSTTQESLDWKSPRFIEGSSTELKTYKNIYVKATQGIRFAAYIDDILVCDEKFTKTEVKDITVPQDKQNGYAIQFTVIGTGELEEIEYKTMGRQNGR